MSGRLDRLSNLDPGDLVTRIAQGRQHHRSDLAVAAEEQDLHAARAATAGIEALDGTPEALLTRPDARRGQQLAARTGRGPAMRRPRR